jgi:hypothetical protein
MSPLLTVVLLSALSALAYAFAAVAQERLTAGGSSGPMRYVRPRFLVAVVLNAGGAGLHVLAIRHGALAVVQSFSALTLVYALPIGAALVRRPVTGSTVARRHRSGDRTGRAPPPGGHRRTG